MPYIDPERRLDFEKPNESNARNSGELNYIFTKVITYYLESEGKSYQTFNDIIGALEGAKQEFYRRIVIPYEDKKIEENGDVY